MKSYFKNLMTSPSIVAVVTMILFYLCNQLLDLFARGLFIGDGFELSYHMFTYTGLMLLAGIVVGCTIHILSKLSQIESILLKEERDTDNN